ncbi:MAG: hypothetical protein Hals2KO_19140 [Halioglobus sp.]
MPFVKRDSSAQICAVSAQANAECGEEVAADDPDLRGFLATLGDGVAAPLDASDQDFIRVLEDLLELLTDKGVILFTELPEFAQRKVLNRRRLRSELSQALDLLEDE